MVAAMVLGGLRRREVLGLRLGDLRVADRRCSSPGQGLPAAAGPRVRAGSSPVAAYLDTERP